MSVLEEMWGERTDREELLCLKGSVCEIRGQGNVLFRCLRFDNRKLLRAYALMCMYVCVCIYEGVGSE